MTESELIDQFEVLQPDTIALVRAVVREELRKWADARRDGMLREVRFIEKNLMNTIARSPLVDKLLCGCSVNGHKCLMSEGGCGRCVEHCICVTASMAVASRIKA